MGYRDLHFEPAVGPEGARLRHVENHLVRTGALLTEERRSRQAELDEQSQRIGSIERRIQGILVWVGAQKVRWGTVVAVLGVVTSVATALVLKALGAL